MDAATSFEHAVRRRLRLTASLVHASQSGGLALTEVAGLTAQLVLALAAERAIRDAATGSLPIDHVSRELSLTALDEDVLLVAAALETDAVLALSLSAIAGGEPRLGVTGKLLAQLLASGVLPAEAEADAEYDPVRALRLDEHHPLVRAGLLTSADAGGLVATLRPWRTPARVAAYLWGDDAPDVDLARCGGMIAVPGGLVDGHFEQARAVLRRALAPDAPADVAISIDGPLGSGRRLVVALAAGDLGRRALQLDVARMATDGHRFGLELTAFERECWLTGAVPVLANLDALTVAAPSGPGDERLARLVTAIERASGPVVMTVSGAAPPTLERRTLTLKVTAPDAAARLRLWTAALPAGDQPDALADLAARFALTPALITRAAANAQQLAVGATPTAGEVHAGIASVIHERFGGLASQVEIRQSWDDLVLPQDTLDDVRAFISRAGNAAMVYERWGFRDKLQRGLGLAALFSGPPGTGKTMVAGLIAKALGLELYMVDLSQVVSKWVGETEKQLGKIFDAAGMGRALLLFDEADALFARRTEVKSSNDRYANLEVNYLLQRLEQFAGVVILTTNLDGSVDPAFKRRMAAEVRFYPPETPERERLWRTLIPAATPIEGELDFAELASEFEEMCGGHIRNAVLRAAFLAAAEGGAVSQHHLERAARTEARNMGKIL